MIAIANKTKVHAGRARFEGVGQVLRFNYPMFVGAGLAAAFGGAFLGVATLPGAIRGGLAVAIGIGCFWAVCTLAVSHLVYDLSSALSFNWAFPFLPEAMTWINVHAGFDQTSTILRRIFPRANGIPVDLFDPGVMTERSIHRARLTLPAPEGTRKGSFNSLPVAARSIDVAFAVFAAHELRTREQRSALFNELSRTLKPGGCVILVEHLRGLANLVAFGPGAFHFFSRKEWLLAGGSASLELVQEIPLTPFARAFVWRKRP